MSNPCDDPHRYEPLVRERMAGLSLLNRPFFLIQIRSLLYFGRAVVRMASSPSADDLTSPGSHHFSILPLDILPAL